MSNAITRPVLLSGIQPSGLLTLGNYLGALKNWSDLQHDYTCLFSIVDLHTITVRQDPHLLKERCYDLLAVYVACGIDPVNNTLFLQSQVPAHTQLAWVLNCYTAMGELNRMTQFKDKSRQHAKNINVGLFAYPVLQAADILLYNTNLVPIGKDQKQHLELTRDIAERFNNHYGKIFTLPEAFIPKLGARVMSLQDPLKKMSKSDANQNAYVGLLDDPKVILKKFKKAVTDSGTEISYEPDTKPGVANLLNIYSILTDMGIDVVVKQYQGKGYGHLKTDLADIVIETLKPIQAQFHALRADKPELERILKQGAERANVRAEKILGKVYQAVGLIG